MSSLKSNTSSNLVTPFFFKGTEYLVSLNTENSTLTVKITDKSSAESWKCNYMSSYVEKLTHRTGNYKQFDIFVTMVRSALLKTSETVQLDLLTIEDLEKLRNKRMGNRGNLEGTTSSTTSVTSEQKSSNKRYLILTYTVEFDRIHYPLPLDYCGPPEPGVLQGIIKRMESDMKRLQHQIAQGQALLQAKDNESRQAEAALQERLQDLVEQNMHLVQELGHYRKNFGPSARELATVMEDRLHKMEARMLKERTALQRENQRLRDEVDHLAIQLEELRTIERNLRERLRIALLQHEQRPKLAKRRTYVRSQAPSPTPVTSPPERLFANPQKGSKSQVRKPTFLGRVLSAITGETEREPNGRPKLTSSASEGSIQPIKMKDHSDTSRAVPSGHPETKAKAFRGNQADSARVETTTITSRSSIELSTERGDTPRVKGSEGERKSSTNLQIAYDTKVRMSDLEVRLKALKALLHSGPNP